MNKNFADDALRGLLGRRVPAWARCALVLLVGWILWKPMGKYIRGDDIKALRGDGK